MRTAKASKDVQVTGIVLVGLSSLAITALLVAFHDRSTKAVHSHILFFAKNWSSGLLWAGKPAVATKIFFRATVSKI